MSPAEHGRAVLAAALALLSVCALWHASFEPFRQERRGRWLEAPAAALIAGGRRVEPIVLGPAARPAWRVLDGSGRPLGYVVPFEGPGFQQRVAGAVAVDAACERTLAVAVFDAHESPTEDLFERHPWFLAQLAGHSCRSPIRLAPRAASGVHAISGASVSSHLLVRHVNEAVGALKASLGVRR